MKDRDSCTLQFNRQVIGSRRHYSSECGGIVLILISVVVFALISSAVYVASIGYGSVILGELQNAADAAALAAATKLEASNTDWPKSRARAIEALNQQIVKGDLGATSTVSLVDSGDNTDWSVGSLRVSVNRGRWIDGGGGTPGTFTSLENWEENTPGRPGFLAFNAVKVTVERVGIDSILSPIIKAVMNLKAEAVGAVGHITPGCVPPMAISVCSLIDRSGESEAGDTGPGDMIFTATSRYCPSGNPGCGIYPAFLYNSVGRVFPTRTYTQDGNSYEMTIGASCQWASIGGSGAEDHFGVIGLPYGAGTVPGPPNEGLVKQAFSSFDPILNECSEQYRVSIGDRFSVLEEGLVEEESSDIIWDRVRNINIADSPDYYHHPPLKSRIRMDLSYNTYLPVVNNPFIDSDPVIDFPTGCSPIRPTSGVCRSKRVQAIPDTCGYQLIHHPEWASSDRCFDEPEAGQGLCFLGDGRGPSDEVVSQGVEPFDKPRGWRFDIPVIADIDDDAVPCQGTHPDAPSTYEDFIRADHEHEIIGFIEGTLYDVDIGGGYPVAADWMAGCPTENNVNTSLPAQNNRSSFGFHGQTAAGGTISSCNLIRARMHWAEDRPIATTDHAELVLKRRLAR